MLQSERHNREATRDAALNLTKQDCRGSRLAEEVWYVEVILARMYGLVTLMPLHNIVVAPLVGSHRQVLNDKPRLVYGPSENEKWSTGWKRRDRDRNTRQAA